MPPIGSGVSFIIVLTLITLIDLIGILLLTKNLSFPDIITAKRSACFVVYTGISILVW